MPKELKATVVNMKHLSQDIDDPVVVGAGDANGRTLRIIFTQEAAAQLTPNTKVYLSWLHQEKNIKGYNIFTEITNEDDEDFPPTWEIHYPQSMLREGNVLACIQLVDDVSIATSTNFMIHVLSDPNDGSTFIDSDDFSDFKKMIIRISCLERQMKDQMESQKIEFEDMQLEFQQVRAMAMTAQEAAVQARVAAEEALENARAAAESAEKVDDFESQLKAMNEAFSATLGEINEKVAAADEIANQAKEIAEEAKEIASNARDFTPEIEEVKQYVEDSLTIFEF